VRRERPRRRSAAEQRDELAPVLTELHAIPHDERGPHRRISNWRRSVSAYSNQPRRISAKSGRARQASFLP
jgi:aminoglycoside phosphotransferase (APT) family kinase protein